MKSFKSGLRSGIATRSATNAPLWTPANLPTGSLSLWFDASDLSTITLSLSSDSVSQWQDKSTNLILATQNNSALRPIYDNNTILANTNTFLQLASRLTLTGDATLIMLASNIGGRIFVPFDTSASVATGTSNSKFMWFDTWNGFGTNFASGSFPNLLSNASFTGNSPAFFSWRRQETIGTFRYNFNAVNQTFNNSNIEIDFPVGARQTNLPATTRYYEMLVVNQALSDSTLDVLEGYLAWKKPWNLQSFLPASHPFKDRAPLVFDG